MSPPQGHGLPPSYFEDVRGVRESSERLERLSRRLVWLTVVLAVETVALALITAWGILR